ncbi:hypothetical protein BDV95DRAFT_665298 [Massariosphaeria phaeospora]|uniref:Secreted protein n=1 Tax=Massariosphaeria phaeospora TaxID=100035 RepID=A0A7C8IC39_9PLEO|nr:hypothetical protein BDV95DRAFT_665298 [Massariosphaeria phaeospora]
MQLTSIFVIAASLATAQAGCFGSGTSAQYWGTQADMDGAAAMVDSICNPGGIAGTFTPGQVKPYCKAVTDSTSFSFTTEWHGDADETLQDADCKERLKKEIYGCEGGGSSTYSNWRFTSDPNRAGCFNVKK